MSDENRTIVEAMGLHWHEGIVYPNGQQSVYKCSCMEHQSLEPLWRLNPDFTTPSGFFECWNWAKEQEWWPKFVAWACYPAIFITEKLIDPATFASKLAAWLKESER